MFSIAKQDGATLDVGLHEGRSLGPVIMVASAAFCIAVLTLCVTGPIMWWRRRPSGSSSVGAPRGRLPVRSTRWLGAASITLGLFLPLFGITLVAVLLFDQLVLRRLPAAGAAFDRVE